MIDRQARECAKCGYPVTYMEIDESPFEPVVYQFVATLPKGDLAGLPAVVDFCPKCGQELSLKTTIKRHRDNGKSGG